MVTKGSLTVNIRYEEVFRYLGYKKGRTKITDQVFNLTDNIINQVGSRFEPRYSYATYAIQRDDDEVIRIKDLVIKNKSVLKLLKKSRYVSVMCVTLGEGLEEFIDEFFEQNRYTEASIADAVGSDAVENAAHDVNRMIKSEADKKGYTLTKRFSPGYGGWELSVQSKLLELSGGRKVGVKVNKNNMLIPRKSITAIIGWGKFNSTPNQCKCSDCGMETCAFKGEL